MTALLISCALVLAPAGGNSPSMSDFSYGAGRAVAIVVAVLVGGVLVALIRAGGSRK